MANFDYVMQAMTVYVDGFGKIGTCEKSMTPKIKKKTEDMRSGGMQATKKYAFGYDAFEFEFDLLSYDPQVIKQVALFSKRNIPLTFRGAFDGDRNQQHTGVLICAGEFHEIDPGGWEAGKKAMLKCKGTLNRLALTMDGAEIYNIDVDTNDFVFNGVNETAWINRALGR